MRRFFEWLVDKLQQHGYLPQHHSIDPRLRRQQYDNHGRRFIGKEEMDELRNEVIRHEFIDQRKRSDS
jgi:hypothetical protein